MRDGLSIRKVLIGLALVGLVATFAGRATFAAYSSATASGGNSFVAGTVVISDNDAGAAMLGISSGGPNASDTSCIKITYSGSLDSEVRLYGTVSGGLAPYLTLTVTRGTDSSAFDTCGSFVADSTDYIGAGAGVVYTGALSAFPANWGSGLVDPTSGSPEVWQTSEAHDYQFTVTVGSDTAGQGQTASAAFTWEAQNL